METCTLYVGNKLTHVEDMSNVHTIGKSNLIKSSAAIRV